MPYIITTTPAASGGLTTLDAACAACGAAVGQLPVMPMREPELHHRPGCERTGWPWHDAAEDSEGKRMTPGDFITRRAVATLGEAREIVRAALLAFDADEYPDLSAVHRSADDVFAHDGAGHGTVGPLPDGTVITVEPVGWPWLASEADRSAWWSIDGPTVPPAQIIAAFNAAQGQ